MLTLSGTKIAVEPLREPDQIGLIHIPESAKSRANQGLVKYIGPDVSEAIRIGDQVLFSGYTGTTIHLEGEGLLIILQEEFIQAIIHDEIIEVPGIYFKLNSGEYIPATFETSISLCAEALTMNEEFQKRASKRKLSLDPQREFENA